MRVAALILKEKSMSLYACTRKADKRQQTFGYQKKLSSALYVCAFLSAGLASNKNQGRKKDFLS